MLELFLFFLFAVLTVMGALGMLISRSPVASALWMVMTMFAVACLYLTLNAAFIGIVQILVYAGAIMVLFLFVIMLLNLEATPGLTRPSVGRVVAFVLGVAVLAQLLTIVALRFGPPLAGRPAAEAAETATARTLGLALLTDHAFALEIVGVLLLAATIGAVILAKKRFT
ncbi:MAG TPA: NADH-quinone oxidoreductase subunit J [Rubricoccaceae bacterium]|nr:NADH-quinone oxidoreductase subunit J [Rubricoccaceae bacterium]